ncbi:MAG TPA: YdiU family protein [Steroidobacteraceae bacterium]|nr:YdiU family protein [Steroidobacteraceae bacterium]
MNAKHDSLRLHQGGLSLASGYARLPERFYARLQPVPVAQPRVIAVNRPLAAQLGFALDTLQEDTLAAIFSGNCPLPGAEAIAAAYAGHQFGQFVPQLGDGRAILLGEVRDRSGVLREIQLKGSGRTPYSRGGDGRAAVGSVLREYLVSEAMHALGIPTTRALAAVATGESVMRDRSLPGAILTRVAASHVRVGTFEYFAARGDRDALRILADHVTLRHYEQIPPDERRYLALLEAVARRQARLVARWMQVGFIHGVMNTDNMSIAGETIDFGPCAFMDAYDPATVFSSIDGLGRYAYANQPQAAQWNLARFAETLVPLIDPSAERAVLLANEVLAAFAPCFEEHWLAGMRRKLGLTTEEAGDRRLVESWLDAMQRNQVDFTLSFRRLADAAHGEDGDEGVRALFADPADFDRWARDWRLRLAREPVAAAVRAAAMRGVNPAFIARNHRVEQVIDAAVERGDYSPFEEFTAVLSRPYQEQPRFAAYAQPPLPAERVLRTFCGT